MITIKVDGTKDTDLILLEYADQIREHAINAIEESLEANINEAYCVEFEIHSEGEEVGYADFVLKKDKWMEFLANSIEPLIQQEEYPLLVKVRELMGKISEKKS